ncbi:hypothetical protein [Roseibacillus persicicus]|uniref:Uncharacterized protein n=1 Tax=Roseibacillus persicicus TaxID=454148 RepID=A0A918TNJ6_9BACT|nr:hypothetical protein [Roseibacillus persicicus]MDQ8189372.1 hypothetical protein [Roseibacillus persicicus]GHC55703.1 hypothetical protein GCM10007100_23050 [Roseibacillus persicicus]
MANAFGIIAALVLAAAAYFGFTNKKALEHQRAALSSEEQKLEINTNEFEEKKETLIGLQDDTKAANEENATLTEQLETQLATNKSLQTDIDDKKSAVESKKAEVEEGREKLARFGDLDNLKRNLEKLSTDLATLKGELLLKDTEIQTRKALSDSLGTENEAISSVLENYAKKQSLSSLNASVSRVVNDLGFVILSGGDNAGIVRDSILDVKRNGQTIGKLKVTGTEPSTAAANIIPDSFEDGMTVRVGDTVVASSK